MRSVDVWLSISVVTQLFSDALNQLETTVNRGAIRINHQLGDREIVPEGMNKTGDRRGISISESPFNYAISYWLKHAMEVPYGPKGTSLSRELWELVRDFLWDQNSALFREWIRVFVPKAEDWHERPVTPDSEVYRPLAPMFSKSEITGCVGVAASYGLVDVIEWAHPDGTDFNVLDVFGTTPLINATSCGEEGVVKVLLSKGSVHVNQTTCGTPTTRQCSNGYCKVGGATALMNAANYQRLGVMKLLLKQPGIEIDLVSHGDTALGIAIYEDRLEAIDLLVGAGAKLAMKDGEVMELPSHS
jgi:hypothetical protein